MTSWDLPSLVLNGMSSWTFLWGGFEVPITSSLFDVFKLFDSLLLTCEITVVGLLLLDLYKKTCIFPSWQRKHHIYLFFYCKTVPQYNQNLTWKFYKTFHAISIEHQLIVWKYYYWLYRILKTPDEEFFFIPLWIHYNNQPRTWL